MFEMDGLMPMRHYMTRASVRGVVLGVLALGGLALLVLQP